MSHDYTIPQEVLDAPYHPTQLELAALKFVEAHKANLAYDGNDLATINRLEARWEAEYAVLVSLADTVQRLMKR